MPSHVPLSEQALRHRREAARRRVRRRRRVAASVLLVAAGGAVVGVAGLGKRDGGATGALGEGPDARQAAVPSPPAELPRGGRRLFPAHRIVAFYGAPQSEALGALGVGTPDQATRRLRRLARRYRAGGRTVLPALELIVTVASGAPGNDGGYSFRQPAEVIDRFLRTARRHDALLLLDVQPGREPFMREVRRLRRWLREPDVGLALDPEWRVGPGEVPGRVLGSVEAAEVNEVSAYLARIVRRHDLPDKPLLVHQFTEGMIRSRDSLRARRRVPLVLNVDGFGGREVKVAKYEEFARDGRRFRRGFKLFFEEDTNLLEPRDVLRLRPRPDVVVYE